MIELRDATYRVGAEALVEGVGVGLRPGRVTAVVGANGAGKTMLLRLASGELTPSAGSVKMDGRPLAARPAREQARRRAVLAQQSRLGFACPLVIPTPDGAHAPPASTFAIHQPTLP